MKRFAAVCAVFVVAGCHGKPDPSTPATVVPPPTSDEAMLRAGSGGTNPMAAMAIEAPLSLTASDGTGLAINGLQARAFVDGSLAFTEMTIAFANPSDRTLEGTFRITLPRGASLGRFAMKIEGQWQEGEVVELEAARRAYEDFLHRKQDPALMEKAAGNEFSARVFPIPARGVKEIVVSYVEEVKNGKYTLPLKGLPELGAIAVDAKIAGAKDPAGFAKQSYTPSEDFVLPVPPTSGAVRSGDLAIVRVQPQADSKPEPLDNVLVLVDTSASRVLGFDDELKAVQDVVAKVTGNVTVAAFDQKVAPIYSGPAKGFGAKEIASVKQREALGASNLEAALVFAKDAATKGKLRRVVLVGDGVATAGATDAKKLTPRVSALKEAGVERMDAIGVGGIRDDAMLTRLVKGTLPHDGVVADVSDASRRLAEQTRSGVAVRVEGATWSWPTKLDGVQAGDTYTVYATLPEKTPLKVSVDNAPAKAVEARITERPLVERAVAQARIGSLLEKEATSKESLKKQIVQIAVKDRIMTPYTAMLVLETEQDYTRFGIKRTSLADVLAIDNGSVKRIHRTALAVAAKAAEPASPSDPMEDSELEESAKSLAQNAPSPSPGAPALRQKPADGRPNPSPRPPPRPDRSEGDMKKRALNEPAPEPAARPKASRAAMSLDDDDDVPAEKPKTDATMRVRPGPVRTTTAPPPPARVARRPASAIRDEDMGALSQALIESQLEATGSGSDDGRGPHVDPYDLEFRDVMVRVAQKRFDEATDLVRRWRAKSPGDVLALVALGEIAEAQGNLELAARAYGSVIDLFSNRADLRRFAGERLERIGMTDGTALDLAIDTFEKAVADRPDHPSSHRLLTFALLKKKSYARAFEVAVAANTRGYEVDRFAGSDKILREDIGLVGAVWAKNEPAKKAEILARVRAAGGTVEDKPSLRFILNWETDANDVDFHIHDARGGHAFYSDPHLASGGDLYADVTTGYGPECFTIRTAKKDRVAPYKLEAHYYSRGPMGYGMGKLQILDHDGSGNLTFEERPFIVMTDGAFVDLGTVR